MRNFPLLRSRTCFLPIMRVSGTLESLTEEEIQIVLKYGISKIAAAPSIYGPPRRSFTPATERLEESYNLTVLRHLSDGSLFTKLNK